MSYTPINWQNGDTITAEKMNKMDNGWGIGEAELFSETITTTAREAPFAYGVFIYSTPIEGDIITVVFDNTSYTVPKCDLGVNVYGYGEAGSSGPDFTNFPFFITTGGDNEIFTQNAGTYTVAVSAIGIAVSEDFETAVNECVGEFLPLRCIDGETTKAEMFKASEDGRLLYFKPYGTEAANTCIITSFTNSESAIYFLPTSSGYTAQFNGDGIFTVLIN